MVNRFWVAALLIGIILESKGQSGCLDPLATNFNPNATQTDSTCIYPTTNWSTTNRISSLPAVLDESSSILLTDGHLLTNLDGGNSNIIYEIDSLTGQIKKMTTIWNFSNVDWEDLAADSLYIYVGDFGNNDGTRTNLRVLRVRKSQVFHPDSVTIMAEPIRFIYPDQTSFVSSSNHNFDCEAFFYWQGKLNLFTKNRGNKKTKWYTLNAQPGLQTAVLVDSLVVNGLVTSAGIRKDGKAAFLLGYDNDNLTTFGWILFGFSQNRFFSGNRRRLELPGVASVGQVEGICFVDDYRLWMSNEKLGNVPARVRQINIRNLMQPFFADNRERLEPRNDIKILLRDNRYFLKMTEPKDVELRIVHSDGRSIATKKWFSNQNDLELPLLPNGLYWIQWVETNGNRGGNLKWINP